MKCRGGIHAMVYVDASTGDFMRKVLHSRFCLAAATWAQQYDVVILNGRDGLKRASTRCAMLESRTGRSRGLPLSDSRRPHDRRKGTGGHCWIYRRPPARPRPGKPETEGFRWWTAALEMELESGCRQVSCCQERPLNSSLWDSRQSSRARGLAFDAPIPMAKYCRTLARQPTSKQRMRN